MLDLFKSNKHSYIDQAAILVSLGVAGGLVLGMFLGARGSAAPDVRRVAGRFRPARLRRETAELTALTRLEDAVLDAFLGDPLLSERGIDVGAISDGLLELSGTVLTRDEANRAVQVARRVRGVNTVLNRLDVASEARSGGPDFDEVEGWAGTPGSEWTGLRSGMGRRRQGSQTEPARPDDSQHQRERAIAVADRTTWDDEGHHQRPRMAASAEVAEPGQGGRFTERELDNQTPFGQNAVPVAEQPQALNVRTRTGEGLKPGTELRLEGSDVPVKPHGEPPRTDAARDGEALD
jgi:hypothetical protein